MNKRFETDDPRIDNLMNTNAVLQSACKERRKQIEQLEWRIHKLRGVIWRLRFNKLAVNAFFLIVGAVACYLCQLAFAARPF